MNQKEINELRRRFRPEKSTISRVYGCYVNSSKEIVSDLDESLGMMPQEESEKYLSLLKKGLSGSLGKNLIDIVFSTQQVADSEGHRLLTTLRDSQLKDNEARQTFYRKVINSLDMGDSSYLLLLACDSYDVPHRGKDDSLQADASDEVFTSSVWCAPSRRARWNWDTSPVIMNSTALLGKPSLLRNLAFCSRHLMTGQQISITLSFTAGRPMKFTRSSLTRSSMWKRRCLPLSRRKHSSQL